MKSQMAAAMMGLLLLTGSGTAAAKTVVIVKMKVSRAEVDVDRSLVGAAIRTVRGVSNVSFDADGKLPIAQSTIAEITYDADVAHRNSIVNAVRDAGYTADGIVPDAPAAPAIPKKK